MILEFGNLLFALLALALSVPLALLLAQCAAALKPVAARAENPSRPPIDVLIPAHNEAAGLAATLESVRAQLVLGDRLLVVADNCHDATAEVARAGGAEVLVRVDAVRRGKGYALEAGLAHWRHGRGDVLIVIDADCQLGPAALETLAAQAYESGAAVQASYQMFAPPDAGPRGWVSQCAVTVKNHVRPLGLMRLGLPCWLTGSGMAFPWPLIEQAPWAAGHLVEDMQLAVEMQLADRGPHFCPQARVTALLPSQPSAARSQRTRWEHGHLQTLLVQAPRLLREAVRQRRLGLLWGALDLAIPPLSLLALAWGSVSCAALVWVALGGAVWPALVLAGLGGATFAVLLAAWRRCDEHARPGSLLAALPAYVLFKLPIYLAFLVRRQRAWIRTARDTPPQADPLVEING